MARSRARGVRAGKAYVELGVHDKLAAGLKRASARLKAFGASVTGIGRRLAIGGAAIGAGFLAATRHFASFGDSLAKMSKRTGVSVRALSALHFAASQTGTDVELLEKGLRRMQRSVYDAGRGLSTTTDALADLGLSFEELEHLAPEDQFRLLADRLGKMEDATLAAGVAQQIFGRSGTMLIPLFRQGAEGIDRFAAQAKKMGLVLSDEDAVAAERLTDATDVLTRTLKMAGLHIGGALAPALSEVSERIAPIVARVGDWLKENRGLVLTIAKVVAGLTAAGLALAALGGVVSAVGAVVAAVTSPLTVLIGGLAAVGAAFASAALEGQSFGEKMLSVAGWLEKAWSWMTEAVGAALEWIRKAAAYAFAAIGFAGEQWKAGLEYLLYGAIYHIVKFASHLKHWFTVAIPAYLIWFRDNWRDVFRDILNGLKAFASNAWKNIKNLWGAIKAIFAGKDWSFEWTPMLEGFESTIKKLPEVAERQIGPAERRLKKRLDGLGKELGKAWSEELEQHMPPEPDGAKTAIGPLTAEDEPWSRSAQLSDLARDLEAAAEGAGRELARAAGATVRGTFGGYAIQGLLAGGGAAERTATATEQTAKNTGRIARQIREGEGGTFV